MRRGIVFLVGGFVLWAATALLAQQDVAAWHIAKVVRLDHARPVAGDATPEAGPARYLHVAVSFAAGVDKKWHEFSVVDTDGNSVGTLWGFNRQQSLLIFERQDAWANLVGLYLRGLDHQEPLFSVEQANSVSPKAQAPMPATGRQPLAESRIDAASPKLATTVPATPGGTFLPNTGPTVIREGSSRAIIEQPGRGVHVVPGRAVIREDSRVIVLDGNDQAGGGPGVVLGDAGRSPARGGRRAASMARAGDGPGAGGTGTMGAGGASQGTTSSASRELAGNGSADGRSGEAADAGQGDRGRTEPGMAAGDDSETSAGSGAESGSETAGGTGAAGESPASESGGGDSAGEEAASGMQAESASGNAGESGAGSDGADGAGLGQEAAEGSNSESPAKAGSGTEAGMGSGNSAGQGGGAGGQAGPGSGLGSGGGAGRGGSGAGGGGGPGGKGASDRLAYRDMPPYLQELHPGLGGGPGYANGGPSPGGAGSAAADGERQKAPINMPKIPPPLVLYISCGDGFGPGKVYQVNEHGNVLGIVNLPGTATGLALHREHGLVCALPRSGQLMRIDETGKVSTLLEKQDDLIRPIDVGMAADSDTIVVADNMLDVLMATSTGGNKPCLYRRFDGLKWDRQEMSVAVTTDRHVIFGSDGNEGIFRFAGDDYSASQPPLLAGHGGVAADTASLRWAATQSPNLVCVFEGDQEMLTLKLPVNKSIYRQGLLSFAPASSVVVAARDSQDLDEAPWLIQYQTEEGKQGQIRSLFPWTMDQMVDFVVGPRMYWNRHSPSTYKSLY